MMWENNVKANDIIRKENIWLAFYTGLFKT